MPISCQDLQRVVSVLADEEELKATVKGSLKGGIIACISTTVGGLVAGPPGMMMGGIIGGALAYNTAEAFKPVSQIINDLNAHQRQLLYDYMKDIIDNLTVDDYVSLMALVSGGPGLLLRTQIVERTVEFLGSQLKVQLTSG
jgi:hypothetical protein